MKKRIGAIGCLKIWPSLDYDELTINMRQNNDEQYGKLLAEVRVGKITQENQNLLSTPGTRASVNDICNTYNTLSQSGEHPVILMPRTAQCTKSIKLCCSKLECYYSHRYPRHNCFKKHVSKSDSSKPEN